MPQLLATRSFCARYADQFIVARNVKDVTIHYCIMKPRRSPSPVQSPPSTTTPIPTHVAMGIKSNLLLMTCRVLVKAPNGSSVKPLALLDSASSASFVSERLAQSLHLPRSHQSTCISGVPGLLRNSSTQHITAFKVSSLHPPSKKFDVTAVIVLA